MTDWTAGYVADIDYTFGYYPELNPLHIKLAFLNAGLVVPDIVSACELGFGQGLSANFHAAGSQVRWHGTDFNPSQANFAQELARASGAGADLRDQSFEEFARREDLPGFDYIGLHGIWSWISDSNRAVIVDFLRRKLNVGGVVYISYNTLPGWAAFAPMRHLMALHAETNGSEGRGIVNRINDSIDFADKLLSLDPKFAKANPSVGERIKLIQNQSRHYLAHEYFNRDWHPMHFATMAQWMETAKLQYACSASCVDHVDIVNLSQEQQQFLQQIPDPVFRESVRDFVINQQFRRDYWVKGGRKLSVLDRYEQITALRFVLVSPRETVQLKVSGARGEATLDERIYPPLLDLLSDHKPRTLGQIEESLRAKGVALNQILQAVLLLSAKGNVANVNDDAVISKARKQTDRLNQLLLQKARGSADIGYLGSPVTGGAIAVGRFHQLFVLAMQSGKRKEDELAEFAWQILAAQNQKLVKEGRTLESIEENLAELRQEANRFLAQTAPLLKALQVT